MCTRWGPPAPAPLALDPSSRTADELNKGIHAGVVPCLFGGWIALLDRFGTMSLAQVLAPAIDYAENGHPIEASVVAAIESHRDLFESFPSSRRMFLPRGRVPEPGETFRMPDLANTLRKVVEAEQAALAAGKTRSEALRAAFDRFYRGDIAEEMARFYAENGGDFTVEDFARYEPIWAEPIHTTYRGFDVYTSPPTSRGGLEVTMQLNLVEGYDLRALGAGARRPSTCCRRRSRSRRPMSMPTRPIPPWSTCPSPSCCRRSTRRLADPSSTRPA